MSRESSHVDSGRADLRKDLVAYNECVTEDPESMELRCSASWSLGWRIDRRLYLEVRVNGVHVIKQSGIWHAV